MKVVGRGGVDLHEQWDGDARAYLGITVPGFPNFFMLYGPNTNIVVNGSIIWFSECEVRYVMDVPSARARRGNARRSTCSADVHDAYNVAHRRREPADGVGRVDREQLVQERQAGASPRTGRSRCSSSGSAPATSTPPTTNWSDVQPIGVSGGCPLSTATALRAASVAMAARVSTVADPR